MSIWGMDSGAEFLVLQMPLNSVNDRYKMPKKNIRYLHHDHGILMPSRWPRLSRISCSPVICPPRPSVI